MGKGPHRHRSFASIGTALSQTLGSTAVGGGLSDSIRRVLTRATGGAGGLSTGDVELVVGDEADLTDGAVDIEVAEPAGARLVTVTVTFTDMSDGVTDVVASPVETPFFIATYLDGVGIQYQWPSGFGSHIVRVRAVHPDGPTGVTGHATVRIWPS